MKDWEKVKKLYEEGTPIRQIAREVGVARNTVRRWIKLDEKPKYTRRKSYPTKIDNYKDRIRELYLERGYIGTKIFKKLKSKGYSGSINPIYRYLKKLREEREGQISSLNGG